MLPDLRTTSGSTFMTGLTLSWAQINWPGLAPLWSMRFTHDPEVLWLRSAISHLTLRRSTSVVIIPDAINVITAAFRP
jgi:hypothetical protein